MSSATPVSEMTHNDDASSDRKVSELLVNYAKAVFFKCHCEPEVVEAYNEEMTKAGTKCEVEYDHESYLAALRLIDTLFDSVASFVQKVTEMKKNEIGIAFPVCSRYSLELMHRNTGSVYGSPEGAKEWQEILYAVALSVHIVYSSRAEGLITSPTMAATLGANEIIIGDCELWLTGENIVCGTQRYPSIRLFRNLVTKFMASDRSVTDFEDYRLVGSTELAASLIAALCILPTAAKSLAASDQVTDWFEAAISSSGEGLPMPSEWGSRISLLSRQVAEFYAISPQSNGHTPSLDGSPTSQPPLSDGNVAPERGVVGQNDGDESHNESGDLDVDEDDAEDSVPDESSGGADEAADDTDSDD